MPPLPTQLRNRLEAAVKQARRTAEAAAKVALERLTVGGAEPGTHLSVDERQLRNRLRAHGRQLGDQRDPKTGTQSISRLLHECAYEHWHRMLFARFLAENHLLIHDKEGMPVTLAECDELAVDEGAPDGWTLAARYAARMLPQIFRPDDPVLQVGFAPEHKRALEKLVTELPVEVFTAEDSLGWVYQFWQAERKDEVNASGDKITGETLPAVTQLFTEHYMVLFLLHNTIGAWWAARLKAEGRIKKSEWDKCQTEDDCRKFVALPGYEFSYLRFIKDGNGEWVPAAGGFPGWPKSLKDFKLLDPCCGSGHFLVAAFMLLVLMRMQDEKLSARDACDAVLRDNLHGLELDPRCTQIAAFALALTAWKFTDGFRPLPPLNIACSGLGVNARKEDWLALANGDTRLRSGLEQLYDLFQKAPELGSLINPRRLAHGDLVTASFAEIQPLLAKAILSEKTKRNDDLNEIGVTAKGMAEAAELLGGQFHLVATNVPYLGRGNQSETLQNFCKHFADDAKADLATVFILRCLAFCASEHTTALVTPQNWLFLASYKKLRERLLNSVTWDFVARLGPGAFETISGEVVNVGLFSFTQRPLSKDHRLMGCDVTSVSTVPEKVEGLRRGKCLDPLQCAQLANPDARILFEETEKGVLLSEYASSYLGLGTGDYSRFGKCFWEFDPIIDEWSFQQGSVMETLAYGGREHVAFWDSRINRIRGMTEWERDQIHNQDQSGSQAWGKRGVGVSLMRELRVTLYTGEIFDKAMAVLVPKNPKHINAIWAFTQSDEFAESVRRLDHKTIVANGTLVKVRFDLERWQRIAAEKYPNDLPEPDSNDPTQWLFNGRLPDSTAPLQVGMARLLGYRWPRHTGQTVSGAPPVTEDGLEKLADEDGIVCIPSVRGEAPAAERLRALLAAAYSKAWSPAKLDELLSAVDYAGSNLEDWLRNGFFDQHSRLFHQRPFIWQIWDGRKDGFNALVNYHKLDHKLLEKLTYTYLGDWIKKQQEAVANEESGADDRLLKAQQLQDKLKLILEGEAPYDIFVRWKPLEQQAIGWHPDLNDGVRLNIRPFMEADVLRKRPNIKWGKDRGKNPPGSPWGEERDNDRHLSLEEKRKARNG
ncbi:MAG: BREX-1 system adenine-specific DNA-methyltransferase PglX [Verrucomicrobia bacterium]|jgi:hypothetical protein|nr:BREX-1 system adenine-specific DNA-methyltransferase PglX [Verrucomicrobiota bacterium]